MLQDLKIVPDHFGSTYIQELKKKNKVVTLPSVSPQAFTCSKLTIETLDQGVKYVQS